MGNIESYSVHSIVKYYEKLSQNGLFNYEKDILSKYFIIPGKILDIGCGTGRTTIALSKLGYDVIGIDYSSKMIEEAKKMASYIRYYVQDTRELSFDSGLFDYALFSFNGLMLLETYADRKKATLEISRVLKYNGLLFFTTPFLDNKIEKKYWAEKTRAFNKPLAQFTDEERLILGDYVTDECNVKFHLHIPFIKEIIDLMDECGYEIIYSCRRLDAFSEELQENELDDNYLWVVRKTDV
ncbi:class I SAM-dependent methyltransferase [Treponema socranskii subsp. buccale]|jgi:methyltransferase|uniref:class I SAM-dependent methyltransferase n=1 Tax=Treponema socranskii TaxID=53419 RepID=UPI0020A35355|nr:class I SAM-dependent methyltransferase [Treponema socranskii]UTD02936.1 class I SAM-dependent methyltransferase [Treponema socranskii subsp. buccale]